MKPAERPVGPLSRRQLAVVDPVASGARIARLDALADFLRAGDLLVVNDAAALPASLRVTGEAIEVRLLQRQRDGMWSAVLFGEGDWRTPTEHRPPPRRIEPGERLEFQAGLAAEVLATRGGSGRLVSLRFDAREETFWQALYAAARPVQYAHLQSELALWDVQTAYASRPWAVEAPSAGFPLSWTLLLALRAKGVELARVTEGCGLSSTGDPELDAALPLEERYAVPQETAEALERTRRRGGRIIAVGTSVVRALETWAVTGEPEGWTSLRLGPKHALWAVDGILSGMHVAGESHHELLRAFAPAPLLDGTLALAEAAGFRAHEFGDAMLVLPGALGREEAQPLRSASARDAMALSGCCLSTVSSQ